MSKEYYAIELDLSGKNPDNLILGEPHTLSDRTRRVVTPYKGLFFGDSVRVRDIHRKLTDIKDYQKSLDEHQLLRPGVDYSCNELHEELTILTGRPVFHILVIDAQDISSDLTIDYQAVGGVYCKDNKAMYNMYDSFLKDGRTSTWNNVLGKPSTFPPGPHEHRLNDVKEWRDVVASIERLTQSVNISNISIVSATVNNLLDRYRLLEVPKFYSSDKVVQKDMLLHYMSRRKINSDFWVDIKGSVLRYGESMEVVFDTCDLEIGERIYWQIYRQDFAPVRLPIETYGSVEVEGPITILKIYIPAVHVHENEILYLGAVKEKSILEWYERDKEINETIEKPITIAGVVVDPNKGTAYKVGVEPDMEPRLLAESLFPFRELSSNDTITVEHPLGFVPHTSYVGPDFRDDFLPILKKFTNRFRNEFDAVTYKFAFQPPLRTSTIYGMMANMKSPMYSDHMTNPGPYDLTDKGKTRFVLDHISMFHFKLR